MSGPVQVKLQGHLDIIRAFRDLRDYLPKNAMRTSVRSGAQLLQQFIALAAPKLTGRLARNITVRSHVTADKAQGYVAVNTSGKRRDPNNAFYWRFLEEGFHTRRGDFKRYPFIAGVFDAKKKEAAQEVINACERAITRAEMQARASGSGP